MKRPRPRGRGRGTVALSACAGTSSSGRGSKTWLGRITLNVLREGRSFTVEITADGAWLVSHTAKLCVGFPLTQELEPLSAVYVEGHCKPQPDGAGGPSSGVREWAAAMESTPAFDVTLRGRDPNRFHFVHDDY